METVHCSNRMDPGSGMVENSTDRTFCWLTLQFEQSKTSMLTGTLFCHKSNMCLRKFSSFLHCKKIMKISKNVFTYLYPRTFFIRYFILTFVSTFCFCGKTTSLWALKFYFVQTVASVSKMCDLWSSQPFLNPVFNRMDPGSGMVENSTDRTSCWLTRQFEQRKTSMLT